MTKRQQIVDAIETALKGVSAFGGRVYPWLRVELPVASLPALAVYDLTQTVDTDTSNQNHELEIEVEVIATGTTAATSIREYMQAVHTAMTGPGVLAVVLSCNLASATLDKEQGGEIIAAARMTYSVRYVTDHYTL